MSTIVLFPQNTKLDIHYRFPTIHTSQRSPFPSNSTVPRTLHLSPAIDGRIQNLNALVRRLDDEFNLAARMSEVGVLCGI